MRFAANFRFIYWPSHRGKHLFALDCTCLTVLTQSSGHIFCVVHNRAVQWLSIFFRCGLLSLHSKPLRTPSFCQLFSIWEITFGRFLAWAPQPPRQKANFRIWPAVNCCHQNQIQKFNRLATRTYQTLVVVRFKLNYGPVGRIIDKFWWIFLIGFWFTDSQKHIRRPRLG